MVEVRGQDTSGLGVYIWDALTLSWHSKLGDSGGKSLQEKKGAQAGLSEAGRGTS